MDGEKEKKKNEKKRKKKKKKELEKCGGLDRRKRENEKG